MRPLYGGGNGNVTPFLAESADLSIIIATGKITAYVKCGAKAPLL